MDLDYGTLVDQAAKIREITAGMKRIANDSMPDSVRRTKDGWHGEAADDFSRKCLYMTEDIEHETAELEKIAEGLERIAEEVKFVAEMAAAQAAMFK